MDSEGLACIVGEQHEPYEAGCPNGLNPSIFFKQKNIEVRANNNTCSVKKIKIWAQRGCLESLALNGSTVECYINFIYFAFKPSPSARSSLEPKTRLTPCGSRHKHNKRVGDKHHQLFYGLRGARTLDQLIKSQLLYQLSYKPKFISDMLSLAKA